jgi:26S proteasome regulatory subunit T4
MTSKALLISNYIARQKDLATLKERHTRLTNEKDDKKKLMERTEIQLKNLENIALKVGDVH